MTDQAEYPVTFLFRSQAEAEWFMGYFSDGGGEWLYMEARGAEDEEEGERTVIRIDYDHDARQVRVTVEEKEVAQ